MVRWKAPVDFLLTVVELLFLSYRWRATRQNVSKLTAFRRGGSVWAKIAGGRGRPYGIFFLVFRKPDRFWKLDTFCYLTVQIAPCYVQSFWHNTGVWQTDRRTDGQTDGIAVASTALAMRALRRAVKKLRTIEKTYRTISSVSDRERMCEYVIPEVDRAYDGKSSSGFIRNFSRYMKYINAHTQVL